ncbi:MULTISPECIES: hypothetical protein [Vibrio]|uniref:Uncharacterized protein n=1 Tax=Vibrio cyclitrophicus ZF270 TaxID=1136176 RepID=A0AAN0LQQ3_9VIBR|nr:MULTISPECIES: hypothetical protein [Vibrio]MBY7659693.1 hypothetical protein [Vibrio atlanticus]UPR28014.1 hypothetical protein ITG08_18405 [Vibrio cyclitrophicus]
MPAISGLLTLLPGNPPLLKKSAKREKEKIIVNLSQTSMPELLELTFMQPFTLTIL